MNRYFDIIYDHAAGYALLSWICERPVFVWPPRFTWLFDALISESGELEQYLASRRLKYNRSRIGRAVDANELTSGVKRFNDVVEFNHSRDVKRK